MALDKILKIARNIILFVLYSTSLLLISVYFLNTTIVDLISELAKGDEVPGALNRFAAFVAQQSPHLVFIGIVSIANFAISLIILLLVFIDMLKGLTNILATIFLIIALIPSILSIIVEFNDKLLVSMFSLSLVSSEQYQAMCDSISAYIDQCCQLEQAADVKTALHDCMVKLADVNSAGAAHKAIVSLMIISNVAALAISIVLLIV